MQFDRTPPQFMPDTFIAPHTFNDPEHPEHGQYVNMQMKNDLYNDALYKITGCEFGFLGKEQEQISIISMTQCKGEDPIWGLTSKIVKGGQQEREMISCQDWKILRTVGMQKYPTSKYRVKIYQTKTDIFYPEVHPPTLWKLFKYWISA